jgi:hypothetical protein
MSLTEAAVFFKKAAKWGLIAAAAAAVLWVILGYAISTYQKLSPPKEVPTVRFGKIPHPTLPKDQTSKNLSFVLDTATGKFPILPTVLPVYPFAEAIPSFLDLDRASLLADSFGFGNPKAIDNQNYVFTSSKNPGQEFRINIVTKNFSLVTTNFSAPNIAKTPPPESTDDITSAARTILQSHKLLRDDLIKSATTVTYVKLSGNTLIPARSASDANFARVDIFRDAVAGYPIVGPKDKEALIHLTLAGGQLERTSLIELVYSYSPYFTDTSSTYPLLPVDKAYDALKNGQASFVTATSTTFSEVRIKDISFGYYEDASPQPYLQPIYLFDGVGVNSGPEIPVRFYFPAVDPSYFSD